MFGGLGGLNPGQMKKLMQQMGIKSAEFKAKKVIVEGDEGNLVVENPQVMIIEMGGQKSLQISGDVREEGKERGEKPREKSDVDIVMEKTGCSRGQAESALQESEDMAEAIMKIEAGK